MLSGLHMLIQVLNDCVSCFVYMQIKELYISSICYNFFTTDIY